jgi:hypothetical protein
LCEGTSRVLRIWEGDNEIWPDKYNGQAPFINRGVRKVPANSGLLSDTVITVFSGEDNTLESETVRDLTGEEFGEYKHDCCVMFENYGCGMSDAIPNFVFEVSTSPVYTEFFILAYNTANNTSRKPIFKAKSDNTINTDWGDNGWWQYVDPDTDSTTSNGKGALLLDDGRILFIFNIIKLEADSYLLEGKETAAVMLNYDGTIDTTWGYNGFYIHTWGTDYQNSFLYPVDIFQCNDDSFILICSCNTGSPYGYHKINSDGSVNIARSWSAGPKLLGYPYRAIWGDDDHTFIICTGNAGNYPTSSYISNTVALNAETLEPYTLWGGLGASVAAGYANVGPAITDNIVKNVYDVIRFSDGFIFFHKPCEIDGTYYTLSKVNSTGTAYDTSWGANGHVAGAYPTAPHAMAVDDEFLYVLGTYKQNGSIYTSSKQIIQKIDSNGVVVDSIEISISSVTYTSIQNFNDYLLLCTTSASPANYHVERWTKNLEYIDGFDIPLTIYYPFAVIPDETTVEYYDANPAIIIRDKILKHTRYGAMAPDSIIDNDSFEEIAAWCAENDLLISYSFDQKKPWQDWADFVLCHFGGFLIWSNGKIKLGAWKNDAPVAAITQDDLIVDLDDEGGESEPPVRITTRKHSETNNRIEASWINRDDDYGPAVTLATDDVDIRKYNSTRTKSIDLSGFKTASRVQFMAERIKFNSMYRMNTYAFRLSYKWMLLEAGDVITLSDGFELVDKRVRITSIAELKDGSELAIEAIDDLADLYPDIVWQSETTHREDSAEPDIVDSTVNSREDRFERALYLSIAPGNTYCTGWEIHVSRDSGVNYEYAGQAGIPGITGGDANSAGTLTTAIPAANAIVHRYDESFEVDIGTVTDLKTTITDEQLFGDLSLCVIDDEIIGFKTCEETNTPGIWRVSNLTRGLFGTIPAAHSVDATFATLDTSFIFIYREDDIGRTLYFKALTVYVDEIQSISSVTAKQILIQGQYLRPAPATLIRLTEDEIDGGYGDYSGATFDLYWNMCMKDYKWQLGAGDYDGSVWVWGDDIADLIIDDGVLFNPYSADSEIASIDLLFLREDETVIGQTVLAGDAVTATITKATDLDGENPASIKVIPRRTLQSYKKNYLQVDDGS